MKYFTDCVYVFNKFILCFSASHLHCNIDGINCLNKYYNDLSVLKAPWSNKSGLVCNCLPSCTEIELNIITDEKKGYVNKCLVFYEILFSVYNSSYIFPMM